MKRNPQLTDEEGVPLCWSRFDDLNSTCTEDCPNELSERCCEETQKDIERTHTKTNDITGKPECYGSMYSAYSAVCQEECSYTYDCRKEKIPAWKKEAISDAKQDRVFRLPVLQNTPSQTIIDPPKQSWVKPVQYWDSYKPTPTYTQSTSSVQTYQNKPTLTEDQYIEYYGALPAKNALIPGQFEGESWYVRLGKEFILRSLSYAVQVAGQLIVEMIGRIRWGPK
jgi:hypothetical protein